MPYLKHVVNIDYKKTFRTEKIVGMFDVPIEDKLSKEWEVHLPCEEKKWNIGLIVGPSGVGKTQISRKIFGKENYIQDYKWPSNLSFLEGFNKDLKINDIVMTLNHIGFSSPPHWLLPYKCLSTGQKFRVNVAKALLEHNDKIIFDEYTSVVDRNVAKTGSLAVQKYIRKYNKQFVAVSCHYDIAEWLQPDWVYNVVDDNFKWVRLRRPSIEFKIYRCHRKAWALFKDNHYLNKNLAVSATCFICMINNEPVAFASAIYFPHSAIKKAYREHRTVVLPDYQGIGVGNRLSNFVGQYYINKGCRYFSTTGHPSMIFHRNKSSLWAMFRKPSLVKPNGKTSTIDFSKTASTNRLTCSFEYINKSNK